MKKSFEINGSNFSSLESFYDEVENKLSQSCSFKFGRNLSAFNDILQGGFGAFDYEEPIELIWTNYSKSQVDLGWNATIKYANDKLTNCHPTNLEAVKADIELAQQQKGETIFELLVTLIKSHPHIEFSLR